MPAVNAGLYGINVKPRQSGRPANKVRKSDNPPDRTQVMRQGKLRSFNRRAHSPGINKDSGSQAKSDDIGQRVKLAAKVGCRVGESRDASVKSVEHNRPSDRLCSVVKCGAGKRTCSAGGHELRPLQRAQYGVVSTDQRSDSEQARQNVHAPPQAVIIDDRVSSFLRAEVCLTFWFQ